MAKPPPWMGSALQFFLQQWVKNWLKIQLICIYTFRVKGSDQTKLCHMTCLKMGIITYVQHLGGHHPLKM